MLGRAILVSVVAVVAAVVGFGFGISGSAADVARLVFYVCLMLLIVLAIAWTLGGRPPL